MRTLRERFDEKVDRSGGPDACWPWTASRRGPGYGQIARGVAGTGTCVAHRLAYEFAVGPIPPGIFVCHRCDNPPCCNPAHLFLGTQADNMVDMCTKERHARTAPKGESAGLAKLTNELVLDLRRCYAAREMTQEQLAAHFGVGQSTVSSIVRRATWGHI